MSSPPVPLSKSTGTPARGLTAAEVAERVARGETNRVRRSNAAAYADIVARNVFTLFNALVVPAAIALFYLDEYRGAIAVSGMAIINMVLGLAQETRAKWHLDRLALLAETRARVLRDGQVHDIPAGDVVRDDLVLLTTGEPVVADGPVVEARFLEVDEALLTGESDPVPRHPGEPLLSGSFCVAGEGSYQADRVGTAAFAQRTTTEARRYHYTASPMQASINRLIRILTGLAVALCAGYLVPYFLHSITKTQLVLMAAATITSMVPQGLVLMATVAFTLGAVRMSRRGALVQRLTAVESMASIDTLCMDKTGTLTTNQLHLEEVRVVTAGLSPGAARDRLRLFACASLDRGNKSVAALRAALGETTAELLDQLPFKSQNRYSAVRVRAAGAEHILVLGACEALRPLVGAEKEQAWEQTWQAMLGSGMRLLLFAQAEGGDLPRAKFDGSLNGYRLNPLALVALSDELRPEAKGVLEALAGQEIDFKVISGDNAETVRATVAPLGEHSPLPALRTLAEGPVVSGKELEASTDPGTLITGHAVFGRVSPWQKVTIVAALKERGRHVAMIGDGVNDVLPIKNANLGIAMGEGSRAAKTVSGLVLETNDFGLLPQTLDEGRTIVRNLRRAGKLFLVKNAFTLILIVGTLGLLHLPFPFLPQQVTLLNFLTIGVPALLITLSRARSTTPVRRDYVREVGGFALRTGVVIGVAGLLLLWGYTRWSAAATQSVRVASEVGLAASPHGQGPDLSAAGHLADRARFEQTVRTLLLSLLVLLGVTTLFRILTDGETSPRSGERGFRLVALAAVPVYLLALYVPPAAYFFELKPLTWGEWGWVLIVALPAYGVLRATDAWAARRAMRPAT